MKAIQILTFILFEVPLIFSENDYCELESCPNKTHVMCQYPNETPSYYCYTTLAGALYVYEREFILEMFDHKLIWDEELAVFAQRWTDQCKSGSDDCRNVERFQVRQRSDVLTYDELWEVETPHSPESDKTKLLYYSLIVEWKNEDVELLKNENRIGCGRTLASNVTHHAMIFTCNFATEKSKNKYCEIESCPNNTHVMCKFPNDKASVKCYTALDRALYYYEREFVLELYDHQLQWDNELAVLAQRWADQCNYGHDPCRDVERFKVRQRSHYVTHNEFVDIERPYPPEFDKSKLAYYSLIVEWKNEDVELLKNENRIGCGKTAANNGTYQVIVLTCNFATETYASIN